MVESHGQGTSEKKRKAKRTVDLRKEGMDLSMVKEAMAAGVGKLSLLIRKHKERGQHRPRLFLSLD